MVDAYADSYDYDMISEQKISLVETNINGLPMTNYDKSKP